MGFRRALHTGTRVVALATMFVVVGTPVGNATAPPTTTTPDETAAGDAGSFAVQPSGPNGPGGRDYFIYTLKDGQTFGDTVGISNLGTKPATFAVYATDARNTTDGSFSLLREEDKPKDVGSWVELGATQYTLEPGKRVDIPFKVTIPANATPGDHVGAIVAQEIADPNKPNDGIGLNVRVRIGARIYVRVDGLVNPSLAVEAFAMAYDTPGSPFTGTDAHISYTLTNTGDIRLSPTAFLKLGGAFGLGEHTVADRPIPELLPGSSIQIAEVVHNVRPYLRLSAKLVVQQPSELVVVRTSIDEWAIPWLGVAVVVLLVVALMAQRVWARRRRGSA